MKSDNILCPICGRLNRNLCMDETGGWMECSKCGSAVHLPEYAHTSMISVCTPEQAPVGLPQFPSERGREIDMASGRL